MTSDISSKPSDRSNRLAKNTVVLYVRMIILIVLNLYISRTVLKALGIDDYGIYDVVCGVVSMFTLLTGSMSLSISRYITIELGKKENRLKKVISASFTTQLLLCAIIIIISESIGLWFVNNKLVIPEERLVAANYIYQFSIISFCVNLIVVPYNAIVIAYERMNSFSYISIFEAILKALIALFITFIAADRLILYGGLMAVVPIIVITIYIFYCKSQIESCRHIRYIVKDLGIVKEIGSFAGWSLLGGSSYILNTQGVNILTNLYFGVRINAARAITTQADTVIKHFVSNFTTALNPQITKSYASGDLSYMNLLVSRGAKYSCYLFLLVAIPFILETDYILSLWLENVPEHVSAFLKLSIMTTLFDTMGGPMYTTILATGKIRKYFIVTSCITLLGLPLTYIFYECGANFIVPYVILLFIYIVILFVKLYLLNKVINFPIRLYLNEIFFHFFFLIPVMILLPLLAFFMMDSSFVRLLVVSILSISSILVGLYTMGLSVEERKTVNEKLKIFISKTSKHS